MRIGPLFMIFITALALIVFALPFGCDESKDNDDGPGSCDQDYQFVATISADFDGVEKSYRFWFNEGNNSFLVGKARDIETGIEYFAFGEKGERGSFKVTFRPEQGYLGINCDDGISISGYIKELVGTMEAYCEFAEVAQSMAIAEIECDDTKDTI